MKYLLIFLPFILMGFASGSEDKLAVFLEHMNVDCTGMSDSECQELVAASLEEEGFDLEDYLEFLEEEELITYICADFDNPIREAAQVADECM